MKKLIVSSVLLLKIVSIISFACFSAETFCMDQRVSEAQVYWNECRKIDLKNEKRLNDFLQNAASTNPSKKIEFIENKLKRLQEEVDEKRKNALCMIKNKYNISDENWNARMDVAQQFYDFEQQNQHIEISGAEHDKNMPADVLLMLQKNLLKNGIAPKRFTLKLSQKIAQQATLPGIDTFNFKGTTVNVRSKHPGKIKINPKKVKLDLLDSIEREALCLIIVHGISEITRYYINVLAALIYLDQYCDKKDQVCLAEKDINSFRDLNHTLSLFTVALKNEYDAMLMQRYYQANHAPHYSVEDYKLFCKINRLHKALAWLKKYAMDEVEFPGIQPELKKESFWDSRIAKYQETGKI